MDSRETVPEVGSCLPLPPDIDDSADDSLNDGGEDLDLFGVHSEGPGGSDSLLADGGLDAMLGEYGQVGELGAEYEPSDYAASAKEDTSRHMHTEDTLTQEARETLDSMVRQAVLSAELGDGLTLPWESGVMATIFGDAPLVASPEIPMVAHTLDLSQTAQNSAQPTLELNPKRQKVDSSCYRLYERAISFKNTMTDPEADLAKWNRALEKLYAVMVSGPHSSPTSVKFDLFDMDRNLQQIRVLCGARSPNTIAKRANSLLQFCLWHKAYFYNRHPIPFEQDSISDYVWEKNQDGMTFSGLVSFVEAVNFGTYVLGLPVKDPNQPIISKFVKGVLDQKALTRPGRQQARPLTVSEVIYLESLLRDTSVDALDRYAAGAFLFALFGRCRWSDLRNVSHYVLDVSTTNGKTIGYTEFSTFSHKTASQVARHGLPLPLVAPIWGLANPCWAMEWTKVAKEVGIFLDESFRGPVLRAPDKHGEWSARSVTAAEATKWLTELLKQNGSNLDHLSSHSLKCTALSWLAKSGTDPHYRLILGHHSTQKGSLETYSRDVLSAPLRALDDVLRQIRVGALHPDLTRSGHIQEPSKPDCAEQDPEQIEEDQRQDDDSSSSSSSGSTSSSESESSNEDAPKATSWRTIAGGDPNVLRSSWGAGVMHQHVLSKVVHLQQESNPNVFLCGMHATKDHKVVKSTPFLESRKCKRCTRVIDAAWRNKRYFHHAN